MNLLENNHKVLNDMVVIRTKKELKFYLKADRMMNRGCFQEVFYSF